MQDEITDLKSDLDNEKDNVKQLKIERKEMYKKIEEFEKKEAEYKASNAAASIDEIERLKNQLS